MPYSSHEKILEYHKDYYAKNGVKIRSFMQKHREKNSEKVKAQKQKSYILNKETLNRKRREEYPSKKEKILVEVQKYQSKNREKIALRMKEYVKERRKIDIQFRLACNLRSRLNIAIKSNQKKGSAVKDLGCSISEFKFYLEGKFKDTMSWGNYGKWHIDHIIPLTYFDLSKRKEFLKACHYTNLQPLWAEENIKKSNKIPI